MLLYKIMLLYNICYYTLLYNRIMLYMNINIGFIL